MRAHVENVRGLPIGPFPGREILAIPFDGDESSACSVYVDAPFEGTPAAYRLNLFTELLGIRQHIASAFVQNVPRPFSGLIITATGFLCDGWHLFAQAVSQGGAFPIANATIRATMAAKACCTDPFVRVPEPLLSIPGGEALGAYAPDFLFPAVTPLGGPNGQILVFSVTADAPASPLVFLPGSRLVELQLLGAGPGNLSVDLFEPTGTSQNVTVAPGTLFSMLFEEEPKAIASLAYMGGAAQILGHVVR